MRLVVRIHHKCGDTICATLTPRSEFARNEMKKVAIRNQRIKLVSGFVCCEEPGNGSVVSTGVHTIVSDNGIN